MHRDSSKHGPRLDDQMKHETQGLIRGNGSTHAERWRETEALEEPAGSAEQPPGRQPGAPGGMSPREVAWRSQIAQVLGPGAFPASRGELLTALERANAPGNVLLAVSGVPGDRKFRNVGELVRAMGVHTEPPPGRRG
ncbi:DUF2795 domain-containing protein [Actinomadura craniellae]|uniref:DUF2795 domain-containing protein n=1 Tax=Actinomadura craniellae TaxID=2231787 RepID=A0A365H959_9ACTN|nr:DUF2795 domain-containing protein [Actinomadura craniellae]RAY15548.1 DUF2795 domain-containing protein [Actinomadura craniellae]